MIEKICECCGKKFEWTKTSLHHKGRFCSKDCMNKYGANRKYPIIEIVCVFCGKKKIKKSWAYKKGWKNSFCSKKCYDDYRKEKSWINLKCKNCGRSFIYRKSDFDRDGRQYCTQNCQYKSRRKEGKKRRTVKCSNCGKIMVLSCIPGFFYMKRKKYKNEFFCSQACLYKKHPESCHLALWKGHKSGKDHVLYGRKLTEKEKKELRDVAIAAYDDSEHVYRFFKGQHFKYVSSELANEIDEKIIRTKTRLFKLKREEVIQNGETQRHE